MAASSSCGNTWRLRPFAQILAVAEVPADEEIIEEARRTPVANDMRDRLNRSDPTLIVFAEHKAPAYDQSGLKVIASWLRRFAPDRLDAKIHHANLLQ